MKNAATSGSRLSQEQIEQLLYTLQTRFEKNRQRHPAIKWSEVQERLITAAPEKLQSLFEMEETEGEPDVAWQDSQTGAFAFIDCAPESPKGRRSLCYDPEALESRKEHKPKGSAVGMAAEMGIRILTEAEYQKLQQSGEFDLKTSSWLSTPAEVRSPGGAIFGDRRFGRVFTYHNGAESYYGVRGFRGLLLI